MDLSNLFAFVIFPYIALVTFVVGHSYRYFTDELSWNSRSSQILEPKSLKIGITLFHWGILATLGGHAAGLLIPQRIWDLFGIDGEAHTQIAVWSGLLVGIVAFIGILMLIHRRYRQPRIRITTTVGDWITLIGLAFVITTGLYNVIFGHYYILDTVAPWIRGIVTLTPDPTLMIPVPFSYKLHVLSALFLLGFSPFTRLVHIWSVPLGYINRSYVLFRRRPAIEEQI